MKNARAGIATLLPLDKIKTPDTSSIPKTVLSNKDVFGLASELINCQSKYKKIFQYIFGNTLIVKDVNTAKSLGISTYRMVTLDGDVFDKSGAITGGYRPKSSGLEFEDTRAQGALVKVESDLEAIKSEMESSERRRLELDSQVTMLRAQKADLGDERGAKDKINKINDLQSESKENEHKIKLLNSSVARLEKELKIEAKVIYRASVARNTNNNIQMLNKYDLIMQFIKNNSGRVSAAELLSLGITGRSLRRYIKNLIDGRKIKIEKSGRNYFYLLA